MFFDLLPPVCLSLYRSELGPIRMEIELACHVLSLGGGFG